jgi:hypothetical protein
VFLIFGRKDFGTKAAHKMLVKFTPGHPVQEKPNSAKLLF